MTKERKHAIKMWEEIVKKLKKGDKLFNLVIFKMLFCKKHNMDWVNDCYFCQYCRQRTRCPISDCVLLYIKAFQDKDIESAETILNALKGVKNEV